MGLVQTPGSGEPQNGGAVADSTTGQPLTSQRDATACLTEIKPARWASALAWRATLAWARVSVSVGRKCLGEKKTFRSVSEYLQECHFNNNQKHKL